MRPSAPEFWDRNGWPALLLSPLGWTVERVGALRRRWVAAEQVAVPVICVGNLVVGGSGKTPIAIDLAIRLQRMGRRPHLLTRGYGGTLAGPVAVDPRRHGPGEVGDEALLLARAAPTWVAHRRPAGAAAAIAAGADVLVLDDGLQNPHLDYDLSLLVVDGAQGFGNEHVMPAGPLREGLGAGLARADAVVLMGEARPGLYARLGVVPRLAARLEPRDDAPALAGREVVAFAGIGRPEKFFRLLTAAGARLALAKPFPDHQPYDARMLAPLLAEASRRGLPLVTTEKDLVRVPAELRSAIVAFGVGVRWEDEAAIEALLRRALARGSAHG